MAQNEQSTGGKAPWQAEPITTSRVRSLTIKDHDTSDVTLVWYPSPQDGFRRQDEIPPFPYQVYLTNSATGTSQDPSFPEKFACFIETLGGIGNRERYYRFEIYRKPFSNMLACVGHQRKETRHRNRNGIWPRIVSKWTTRNNGGYKGCIIVIDRDDWESEGVVLVRFDPAEYDHQRGFPQLNHAGEGDIPIVRATLEQALSQIPVRLTECWLDAGGGWTEADLARRNDGGFSPALYPAVDPMSHYDVEHEDVHELDGTALPGPAIQPGTDAGDDKTQNIRDDFDKSELFKRDDELRAFEAEMYSDSFGLPVSSVWSSSRSKMRPSFSFTLYMAFDVLPIHPKALFSCLNKGLIEQEAWTLDIVSNMPSLDAAFEYHTRAAARRTTQRTCNRAACMRMLLHKVAGSKLPTELLEYIEAVLVPPEIPHTSSYPCRQFQNTFLYFDSNCLSTGPLLVYSNPLPSWSSHWRTEEERDVQPFYPARARLFQENLLEVLNLFYWYRVVHEIHVVWSMCSPRAQVHADEIPSVSLKMEMPEVCEHNPITLGNVQVDVRIILRSCETINIHRRPFLSHDIWYEALEIVDVDTGKILPQLPFKPDPVLCGSFGASWAQLPQLGHRQNIDPESDQRPHLCSLQPGLSDDLAMGPFIQFWEDHRRKGHLVDRRKYAVRLRSGVVVPRWTYGSMGDPKGPYNLPPIPVTMDDQLQFTFRYKRPKLGLSYR